MATPTVTPAALTAAADALYDHLVASGVVPRRHMTELAWQSMTKVRGEGAGRYHTCCGEMLFDGHSEYCG